MKNYDELFHFANQLSQNRETIEKALDLYSSAIDDIWEARAIVDLSTKELQYLIQAYTAMLLLTVNHWSEKRYEEYRIVCDRALQQRLDAPIMWHNCIFVYTAADDVERTFFIANMIRDFSERCCYVSLFWLTTEQLFYVEGLQSAEQALRHAYDFLRAATALQKEKDVATARQWIQYYSERLKKDEGTVHLSGQF